MLYNLVQYLITEFPNISFVADGYNTKSPIDCIVVKDSGGILNHYSGRPDITVQFLSRSSVLWKARDNASQVFEKLKNRIGLVLPVVTVNNIVYPQVTAYRIVPIQRYGYLGTSAENQHLYSFNSIVTLDYS